MISAKKVMAKSVRSSQQKKFDLPASNRDSEDRRGEGEAEDRKDARGKFLVKRSGPFSVQQSQTHHRRSHEGSALKEPKDDGDCNERGLDLLLGQGAGLSRVGQLALRSTDGKAAKKKIDIKNLIN